MVSEVYFFIPNIIGYIRILLAFIAFYDYENYKVFGFCYFWSEILDMLDGHAARYFNQATKYGAVLDMVTDRASSAGLLLVLSHFYPQYVSFFLALNSIDLVSHFAHLYSSMLTGQQSHKTIKLVNGRQQNFILRLYYTNKYMLAFMCAGNEGFFWALYILHFTVGPIVYTTYGFFTIFAMICFPVMVGKQAINIIQFIQASKNIVSHDVEERNKRK